MIQINSDCIFIRGENTYEEIGFEKLVDISWQVQ